MTLERNNLIQVNAIIITGLLILLSLSSLSSPIYETQIVNSLDRMADMGIKFNQINQLYDEYCIKQTKEFSFLNSSDVVNQCKIWEVKLIEATKESKILANNLESAHILTNNTANFNAQSAIWAPWFVKILVSFMLVPFIASILFEIARKDVKETASKISMISFAFGLFGLLIGFMIITNMLNCSVPQPALWDCSRP